MVGKPKTPYLAGAWVQEQGHDSSENRLPQIQIRESSNRLSDDAAQREERRKALSDKVWESRDSETRWNKRNVNKGEVEAGVGLVHFSLTLFLLQSKHRIDS
jgi:hypothetical protein